MSAPHIPQRESVTYRQQYTRCGKAECRRCAPGNPGHGPYWYAYWREGRRVRSRYLGKQPPSSLDRQVATDVPAGDRLGAAEPAPPSTAEHGSAATALRLRTLGSLAVWRGGDLIPAQQWRRRKATLLLALLLTRPARRVHREQAADMLWPEATGDQMLINLRATLHLLRKILDPSGSGDSYVQTVGEWLILQPSPGAEPEPDWWDVETFVRAEAEALAGTSLECCRSALRHYQGDFLADFPYVDWIAAPREALRRQYLALLLHHATLCSRQDELPEAIQTLEEVLRIDPVHEAAARLQMRLLAACGQRTAALRVYRRLAEMLDRDLNVAPQEETATLHEAIAHGRSLPRVDAEAPLLRPIQPAIDALLPKTLHAPLIGRQRVLAGIRALLQRAQDGHGGVILLSGVAGVGKSRVLEEVLRDAAGRDMLVLWGRAYQAEGRLPYGPLLEALRSYVAAQPPTSLARQLGSSGTILLSILPELSAVLPAAGAAAPLDPGAERHRLFAALADWLRAICRAIPVMLALEDLQWADNATMQTVHYLARICHDAPLVLCVTYRQEDPGTGALARMVASLQEGSALSIDLPPLAARDARSLLTTLLAPHAAPDDVLDPLCQKAQGNALLLEELVQVCRAAGWLTLRDGRWLFSRAGEIPVPASIRALLAERLERLDAMARRLLRVCAVLGDALTYPVLRAVSGLPEEDLLDALERAAAAGLLLESASGYRFQHPLLRDALYQGMSRPRRVYLHRTLAEALVAHAGTHVDEHAATLAWHFGQAEEHAQAGRYALRAATRAAAMYANGEAIAHLLAARDHLLRGDERGTILSQLDEQLGDLRQGIGDLAAASADFERARHAETNPVRLSILWQKEGAAWEGRGAYARALEAYERASTHAAASSDRQTLLASLEIGRSIVHYRRGDYAAAEAASLRALTTGSGDMPIVARAANVLGNVARGRGRHDQAMQWHQRSLAIWDRVPERERDLQAILGAWGNLGITAYVSGELDQAEAYHLRSLGIAERIGDQRAIAYSWYNLAMVFTDRGDLVQAEAYHHRSLALRESLDDCFNIAFSLEGLGQVAYLRGDLDQADRSYERALAIWEHLSATASTVHALARRGAVACERGDLPGAASLFRHARRLNRRLGLGILALPFKQAGFHLRHLSGAGMAVGTRRARLVAALVVAGEAGEAETGSTRFAAEAALLLAALSLHQGAIADAEQGAARAQRLAEASGRRREAALARRLLGQCCRERGDWPAAVAHLRAALALLAEMGAELEWARTCLALAEALYNAPAERATEQAYAPGACGEARHLLETAHRCFAACGAQPDLAQVARLQSSH